MSKQAIDPKTTYPNVSTLDKMPRRDSDQPKKSDAEREKSDPSRRPTEIGGPKGLEPTRYGDWEKNGRCIDF